MLINEKNVIKISLSKKYIKIEYINISNNIYVYLYIFIYIYIYILICTYVYISASMYAIKHEIYFSLKM